MQAEDKTISKQNGMPTKNSNELLFFNEIWPYMNIIRKENKLVNSNSWN